MTTPIPNKTTILEKAFLNMPWAKIKEQSGSSENGDPAIPCCLVSRCLFQYLCPLRALRTIVDEKLLLFFMSAPTFGFCVKIEFNPKWYNYSRVVQDKQHRLEGEIEQAEELCLRALRELGEKGFYLAQLHLDVSVDKAREVLAIECLPKLNRLEVFSLSRNFDDDPERYKRQFRLDQNPQMPAAVASMFLPSRRHLVELTISLSEDVEELRTILTQTSCLRKFSLTGQRDYSGNVGETCLINAKTIEVIATSAPNIQELEVQECVIDNGFFKQFVHFKRGLCILNVTNYTFSSDDELEWRYLAENVHDTLEEIHLSSSYGATSANFERNPFLGFTGRLRKSSTSDKVEETNDEKDLICFPYLRAFRWTPDSTPCGEDCLISINHLSFPILETYSVYAYSETGETCSVRLLETLAEHPNLTKLRLPEMKLACDVPSELNRALNTFGENLTLLEDINLPLTFIGISDEDFKEKITFEGWKNLKRVVLLRDVMCNDHLLKVIGEHWGDNRFSRFVLTSASGAQSFARFITDDGLAGLARITSSISHASHASELLKELHLESAEDITDSGTAHFLKTLWENADNNPALSGADRKMFRGIGSFKLPNCKQLGMETCKALTKYNPVVTTVEFCRSQVNESCFEELAKLKKLEFLQLRAHSFKDVSNFQVLADNLMELTYLELYRCFESKGAAEKHKILRKMFAKQKKRNDIYIAIDGAESNDDDDEE